MFSSAVSTLYFTALCKQGRSSANLSFNFFENSLLSLYSTGGALICSFFLSYVQFVLKKALNIASMVHSVDNFSLTSTSDKRIVSVNFYMMAGSKNVVYA